jgi:hypothetical protein
VVFSSRTSSIGSRTTQLAGTDRDGDDRDRTRER